MCANERIRLMWIGAGLWHDPGFYNAEVSLVMNLDKYKALRPDQRAFLDIVLAPGYDRKTRMQHYAADIAVDYDFSRNVRHE